MAQPKTFADFTWGLNANTTNAVGDKDLVIAENVFYNAAWQLQTRRGYRKFGSEIWANPITSYFFYQRDDTQAKVAICVSGSQMYYLDNSAARQPISWAGNLIQYETIPWRTTKRTRWDFAVFKNKAYMCDGVNPYCSFDWTTFAQIGVWSGVVCTFDNATDLITKVWHWLAVNDEVYFTAATTMPAWVTAYQIYYVSAVPSADTFQISTTPSGTAVNFTTNWTGTINYYKITEPRVRYLLINSWVCWSAGEDKNPITAYYSNALTWLSDLTNINTNLANIWPWENGVINGLTEYAQGVLIMKSEKIHYASLATGAFVSSPIDSEAWWYADRAIDTVGNSLVYFSDRGIDSVAKRTWVDGAWALESQPLSAKIRELLAQIDPVSYNSWCARYIKPVKNYHFMFDSNGDDVPDTMCVYSSLTGGRTTYTFPEIYDFGEYIDSDGNTQYLFASANGGQMYEYEYWFDDDGVAIQATVKTKNYNFGEWFYERIEVEGRKEQWDEIDLTVYIDNEEAGAGEVTNSNLSSVGSLSIGVAPVGISSLWWWDATTGLELYRFKVRIPMYARGSEISLQLQSEWVQRIYEKMTVKHEWETYEVFPFNNIL